MNTTSGQNKRFSTRGPNAKNNAKQFLHSWEINALSLNDHLIFSLGLGSSVKKVAESFKVSRQRVEYHAKKAVANGFLRREGKYPALYYLTERGRQKFLSGGEGVGVDGRLSVRQHGACLAFEIVRQPSRVEWERFLKDAKSVPLEHWTAHHAKISGLSVTVTTGRVLVYPISSWVDSDGFKERAVLDCMSAAQEVAAILCNKYGFKLDILAPELITIPQYALPDFFTRDGEKIRFSFEKGNVDYSKGFRELEYKRANNLSDFLSMPYQFDYRLEQMEQTQKQLLSAIEKPKKVLRSNSCNKLIPMGEQSDYDYDTFIETASLIGNAGAAGWDPLQTASSVISLISVRGNHGHIDTSPA